jgi:Outer membrane protein beta-barrel family/Carboxypeptidase regulatory-like domain
MNFILSKHCLLTAILLFSFQFLFAQTAIKGKVVDSSENKPLHNATITLLRIKDSVLVTFTRTDKEGNFMFQSINPGKYFFEVSYPGYASFGDSVENKSNEIITIATVNIIPKAKLLQEIIVKQKVAAIRIKGDTTEYKADSFQVGPNANVQDLLKRLPGLQVNAKGEITAQGQKVEKILVDGEEFFSDDPAVVSQNLRADVVDKVQVFDKKSEQAEFTGVDDGQKTKTINLELKDDKKKGYFGKLEAGTDFNQYRNGKAMINSFQKKQKIAAYLTHNNTSFEGLNWNEQRNFGNNSNSNMEVTEDGGIMMWSEGDDFSRGQGLPQSTTGGLMYMNKWNKDKNSINSSFQYNNQDVNGRNGSITRTILPDTSFSNTTSEVFKSFRSRQKLNTQYEWQIDSSSTLKVKANGAFIQGRKENKYTGQSLSEENNIINKTERTLTNETENRDFTSELSWRKKLKKKGRTISFTGNWSNNLKTGDGFLLADNSFFDKAGAQIQQQDIDQKKTNNEQLQNIQTNLVYTEPLSKKIFLELTYKNAFNRNDAERNTLEKTPGNGTAYNSLVDSLSNHFLFRTTDHAGGFSFRFAEKKYTISVGSSVGNTQFNLDDLRKNEQRSKSFINLLPGASIKFNPKKQKSFTLSYNGNTQNPTLQQINPVIDNTDPLNITIGNQNLKQAFRHNLTLNISDYKIIKSKNFYLWSNFSFVNNAITNANRIDSLGRRINQSINVNGNYNGSVWAMYGFEVGKGINLSFNTESSTGRFVNFVNGIQNISNNHELGLGFGISKWSDKWISFGFNAEAKYNMSRSSINKEAVTRYWSFNSYPNVDMNFKKQKLYVSLNGNFNVYERTETFRNQQNIFIINGSVRKTFTKTDAFEIKLSVNDLLNQNLGVQRNITSNFVSENTFQNIRRFWLLTFTWNFTKNGKPSNDF